MSPISMAICEACKCKVRSDRLVRHQRKCPSRNKVLAFTPPRPVATAEKTKRVDDSTLTEFSGVKIPSSCQRLRFCSVTSNDSGGITLISNSGVPIHDFSSYACAQRWYDELMRFRRLPIKPLQFIYHSPDLSQTSKQTDKYVSPNVIRYSETPQFKLILCSCGARVIPGEDTCYSCKSE